MPETLLTDEERHDLYRMVKEAAEEKSVGEGFVLPGSNPYAADWQMDLGWPERAGVQVGDDWVEDDLQAEVVAATYVVGQPYKRGARAGQLRASTLKRMQLKGDDIQKIRESAGWEGMREWGGFPDPFAYGTESLPTGGVLGQYIPLWPGPVTRQLYWQDYWMMSAKAFEAYNHDPISWRCVHMKAEFSLGKGLECKVTKSSSSSKGQDHTKAQQVWDEFWQRNRMDLRLDTIARDYCWAGEQFLRYFKKGPKLTIRALDPATIYDLITDPEDIETVFAYHQQFQTAYQLYPPNASTPPGGQTAPTGPTTKNAAVKYIIRQILPQEIDHYKSNASGYERRGRSDLFPALGWIKRLRDYLTAHVIQADMLSRICWDLEVAGNAAAIQSLRGMLFPGGRAPAPGTVFGHNTASKLTPIAPRAESSRSSRGDPILDAIVTLIADSIGLPKDWLGFGMQNTRAGALVATEPAAKSLEELQGTLETIIHDAFRRVMMAAGISDAELEVTFPSIASEDRKAKLDDLGTMEANDWISKKTAATMAAKEIGITTYDYTAEQTLIAAEFEPEETTDHPSLLGPDGKPFQKPKQGDGKARRTAIIATKRQVQKIDVTRSISEDIEPPGLMVPEGEEAGGLPAPGSPDGTKRTVAGGGSHDNGVTRGGAPANENANSGVGARNIRKDNTNIREGEPVFALTLGELGELLRESRPPRRKPADPDFQAATARFRTETASNLAELLSSTKE